MFCSTTSPTYQLETGYRELVEIAAARVAKLDDPATVETIEEAPGNSSKLGIFTVLPGPKYIILVMREEFEEKSRVSLK